MAEVSETARRQSESFIATYCDQIIGVCRDSIPVLLETIDILHGVQSDEPVRVQSSPCGGCSWNGWRCQEQASFFEALPDGGDPPGESGLRNPQTPACLLIG